MAHIVILGGGFGGTRAALDMAKKLDSSRHQVTLIDKSDSHLFLPSLYEVASARKIGKTDPYFVTLRNTICLSYGRIFSGSKVNFMQGEITAVNLQSREVYLASGSVLQYDYLVVSLGSDVATFGIPGVREYSYQFKKIEDALALHKKIHQLHQEVKDRKKPTPVRILVCGAGFTGIELAGELASCTRHIRRTCKIGKEHTEISIFEAGPKILPMVSDGERRIIRKRLSVLGVSVFENTAISEIGPSSVKTKDGRIIEGDIIVWTAGIRASSFVEQIGGLHLDERDRIKVNEFLQAMDQERVFALGDNACIIDSDTQKPVPGLGYVAAEQGRILARNIANLLSGRPMEPYKPKYEAWIAPIGGKYAVAHISRNLTVAGFFGWLIKMFVDGRYFIKTLGLFGAGELIFQELKVFTQND